MTKEVFVTERLIIDFLTGMFKTLCKKIENPKNPRQKMFSESFDLDIDNVTYTCRLEVKRKDKEGTE
ncbi:hypothetical protein ACXM1Q_001805 [Streptococcus sp. 10F2]